jgi:hypothetical protein
MRVVSEVRYVLAKLNELSEVTPEVSFAHIVAKDVLSCVRN